MPDSLAQVASRTDLAVATARAELVAAVRAAAAEGMSQNEIARAIGRSQPEVSRLLRFHGRSPLGMRLRKRAIEVRRLVAEAGGSNVRVLLQIQQRGQPRLIMNAIITRQRLKIISVSKKPPISRV